MNIAGAIALSGADVRIMVANHEAQAVFVYVPTDAREGLRIDILAGPCRPKPLPAYADALVGGQRIESASSIEVRYAIGDLLDPAEESCVFSCTIEVEAETEDRSAREMVTISGIIRTGALRPWERPFSEEELHRLGDSDVAALAAALTAAPDPRVIPRHEREEAARRAADLRRLLNVALRSDELRLRAIRCTARLDEAGAVERLREIVRSSNREERLAAIEALGETRSSDAIDVLQPFIASADEEERVTAAASLFRLSGTL